MKSRESVFDVNVVLHQLKHYLPSQAPLKDFIHHNTLHAFQKYPFHKGLQIASETFGYKVYLGLDEFRFLHQTHQIKDEVLRRIIVSKKGIDSQEYWHQQLLFGNYQTEISQNIGKLRHQFKLTYKINLDKEVHPILFRLIGSYLDQGISLDRVPLSEEGFIESVREIERNSYVSLFKSNRVKQLLMSSECNIETLLKLLIGREDLYTNYLFDQQFAHPGWSGMVANLEGKIDALLEPRNITLYDFILLELLLEIDCLDSKFKSDWKSLETYYTDQSPEIFSKGYSNELYELYAIWQEAYEWSYYDEVLKGLQLVNPSDVSNQIESDFQAVFCIDDRECSFRRHLEKLSPDCQTYGTAGFFNVEFYFQPENGKYNTKVCPAPITPKHIILETEADIRHKKDAHFSKHLQGFFGGWLISQTMGFFSALKLASNIFSPSQSPATVSSSKHMDPGGKLSIECKDCNHQINGLQVGFNIQQMTDRVEGLLKSIGLTRQFSKLIYIIGHGASSTNNTHFAGYDCGACSGRAGSVNARVFSYMANHELVREELIKRGIIIPENTQFIGGLHDTTKDEITFFDTDVLSEANLISHQKNIAIFNSALDLNAKERSRRFVLLKSKSDSVSVHNKVKLRAFSLFEPRPEWNHATNTLCMVGRRNRHKHLFLDRRAFLNSYDYEQDQSGKYLLNILNAVSPVCGGINLEYYFSRVDNYRLGAGSKLPHNVMGLLGVANGMDGDLRTGLPKQMINIHDPLRLMVTVEHFPDVVLEVIQKNQSTYEWYINNWIHLVVIHPITNDLYYFKEGDFILYKPLTKNIEVMESIEKVFELTSDNAPVYIIQN